MNEKITLPGLTQYFALQTGDSKKQSEDFIREFFALISETVVEGDQVKIKDFGVFKTITVEARKSVNVSTGEDHEIPQHRKIVFVPSKEIAALVNEPFEMFETVEINDDVDLEDSDDTESPSEFDTPVESDSLVESDTSAESESPAESETPVESEIIEESDITDETLLPDEPETVEQPQFNDTPEVCEQHPKPVQSDSEEEEQPAPEGERQEVLEEREEARVEQPAQKVEPVMPEVKTVDADADNVYTVEDYDDEQFDQTTDAIETRGRGKSRRFLWGFLSGFFAAVVVGILVVAGMRFMGVKTLPVTDGPVAVITDTIAASEAESPGHIAAALSPAADSAVPDTVGATVNAAVEAESAPAVPTEPSDKKVYDTITKTRYLTTMAKDHYGNFNLWPYIYIENKAFLGHPDRIRPGTQVVIPPLSKYGVDPKNPADIAAAKKKGVEIYSRYK